MSGGQRKSSRFSSRVNSLGMASSGLTKMIDALEQSTEQLAAKRRDFVRWPFRKEAIQLTLTQPGQRENVLVVACRNVSTQGMSLLHADAVEPGCACSVVLPRFRGEARSVCGRVVRCEQRTATLFEIGVRFDESIDLKEFVGAQVGVLERFDIGKLRGVVVFFSAFAQERAQIRAQLRDSALALKTVVNQDSLLRQVNLGCDAVVIAGSRETVRELVRLMPSQEHAAIGVIAENSRDASLIPLSISRVDRVLAKPCAPEDIVRFVAELLHAKRFTRETRGAGTLWDVRKQLESAAEMRDAAQCSALCAAIEELAGETDLTSLACRTRALIARAGETRVSKLGLLVRPLLTRLGGENRTNAA